MTSIQFFSYCLFSNREGLGLQIMGLAAIDPHIHKDQTKLYKIPKFGVNRPKSKQDTAIWKSQNLQRLVWPCRRCPTQHPDAIHFFVNYRCISVKTRLINTNLGILWISVCSFWLCRSIVANPIIYRLIPSPSRFEIRQWESQIYTLIVPCGRSSALMVGTQLHIKGLNPLHKTLTGHGLLLWLLDVPYPSCSNSGFILIKVSKSYIVSKLLLAK